MPWGRWHLESKCEARQVPRMNFERYAGTASAVGVVLVLTMVGWLGVAGPVWRACWTASPDQWLGFAGASRALVTLEANGFDSNSTSSFIAEVKSHIPSADDADQRRLAGILRLMWVSSGQIASCEQRLKSATDIASS